MTPIEQAQEFIEDYGKCSYSTLVTKQIIEGLLEHIKAQEKRIEKARYALL